MDTHTSVNSKNAECELYQFNLHLKKISGQTKSIDVDQKIAEVRGGLESELSIPSKSLSLMNLKFSDGDKVLCAGMLDDAKSLKDYGVSADGKVGVELRINYYEDPKGGQAGGAVGSSSVGVGGYRMPDVLAINVPDGRGGTQVINVAVERPDKGKSYLGGYKHIQTGKSLLS